MLANEVKATYLTYLLFNVDVFYLQLKTSVPHVMK